MLSKELLTRWNREAIVHAKDGDLKALDRRSHSRRRDPMDPRAFFEAQTTTPSPSAAPSFATSSVLRTDRSIARQTFARTFDYNNRRVWGVRHCSAGINISVGLPMIGSAAAGGSSVTDWTIGLSGNTFANATDTTLGTAHKIITASGAGMGLLVQPPSEGGVEGFRRDLKWWLWLHMKTGAAFTANCRQWFGEFSANPGASDTMPVNSAGFRFATVAGDTVFRCQTRDGATLNDQSSGITAANSTEYILEVLVNTSNNVEFYINNVLVATSSANLPSLSVAYTNLGLYQNAPAAGTQDITWTQIMFAKD